MEARLLRRDVRYQLTVRLRVVTDAEQTTEANWKRGQAVKCMLQRHGQLTTLPAQRMQEQFEP
jgi:hypothetical protein